MGHTPGTRTRGPSQCHTLGLLTSGGVALDPAFSLTLSWRHQVMQMEGDLRPPKVSTSSLSEQPTIQYQMTLWVPTRHTHRMGLHMGPGYRSRERQCTL